MKFIFSLILFWSFTRAIAFSVDNLTPTENSSKNFLDDEHEVLKELLKDYDWRIRPKRKGENGTGPVDVECNVLIRSMSNIDEANMAYTVQITFREQWIDKRLAFDHLNPSLNEYIVLTKDQQIWMPDTFFPAEKNAHRHNIDQPNVLIRIHKDGRILYSVRLTMTLSCPMNFKYYPLDVQTCHLGFASYAYTEDDIRYTWKVQDPVQFGRVLFENSLPQFEIFNHVAKNCTSMTNTGTYSCLSVAMEFKRRFGYYLFHLYIPGAMLVIISWVSFWLDPNAVPGRVTLGVTTLLTMATQTSNINSKLPPVSYIKAIDVWIGMCTAYLFGALIEFAFVHFLYNKQLERNKRLLEGEDSQRLILDDTFTRSHRSSRASLLSKIPMVNRIFCIIHRDAKNIDAFSRLVFPITFFFCNISYWSYYTKERFET